MKLKTSGKLCPICSGENEETTTVCIHCGAWLEEKPTQLMATSEIFERQPSAQVDYARSFIDVALIPEDGVGIYIAGELKPYYIQIYKELIIGRPLDATLEAVLDLSEHNAANLGVSKRHVMIRRTVSGFEVIDLSSRNGTWLNAERLVPNKPYPFPSGSQVRIGQMRLLVMYHPAPKDK
ncbi:MAG: FHA domain-containing protein [Chloroflexota bacterium]